MGHACGQAACKTFTTARGPGLRFFVAHGFASCLWGILVTYMMMSVRKHLSVQGPMIARACDATLTLSLADQPLSGR